MTRESLREARKTALSKLLDEGGDVRLTEAEAVALREHVRELNACIRGLQHQFLLEQEDNSPPPITPNGERNRVL